MANSPQQDIISRLRAQDEGLAVLFHTVAAIYQYDESKDNNEIDGESPGEEWTAISYGIPSIFVTASQVTLSISDLGEDLPGLEIVINSSTQIVQINEFFTVIGIHNSIYYGLYFADEAVARKIMSLITLALPHNEDDISSKRMKLSSSSFEGESNPKVDNEPVMGESNEASEQGVEDVDSGIFRRNTLKTKSPRSRSSSPTISDPAQFRHISHVDDKTSVGDMTRAMAAGIEESMATSSKPQTQKHRESGTESTLSFNAVNEPTSGGTAPLPPPDAPPPPPPPDAPPPPPPPTTSDTLKKMGAQALPGMSLQDELLKGVTLKSTSPSSSSSDIGASIADEIKRGVVLRPVGASKTLPKPPPLKNHGQLLFEINTFKRNTLRHVERRTTEQTDDPNSLQSVLKSSLEKMRGRLNMRNFSRVASVDQNGDVDGFEDFDGPLFASN